MYLLELDDIPFCDDCLVVSTTWNDKTFLACKYRRIS